MVSMDHPVGSCEYETRIKEHHQHNRLYHTEKLAMAKCSINLGDCNHFHFTSILVQEIQMYGMHHQGSNTNRELHPNNMNMDEGFSQRLWKLLIQTLMEQKKALSMTILHTGPFQVLSPCSSFLSLPMAPL